jgi:hypothetical protein
MSQEEKNYDDNVDNKILNKPSAFISLAPVSKHLNTMQYKYYDILLYNAKEMIAKTGKTDKFKIKLSTLKKMAGDCNTQKKRTKEYLTKLMDLTCTYNILGKEGKMEQNGIFALVAGIDIKTKPGTLIYSFPHQVIEVLVEGLFAKIDMSLIKEFKSKYSVKLYELCKDYENSPHFPKISMDKLGRLFDYEYDKIERIKSCVLNPAIEEINNNDKVGFFVRYALLKSSENKQFHSIQFTVNKRLHYPDVKGRTLSNGSIKLKDGTVLPKAETEFTVAIEKENEPENEDLKTNFQEPVLINIESVISGEPKKELEEEIIINADLDKDIAKNQTDFIFNRQEELNKCYTSQNKKETKEEPLLFDLNDIDDKDKTHTFKNQKKQKINFNFETSEWENIPEYKISLWEKAYPACDINLELIAMAAWLTANPEHRKSNYERFIVNWLSKTQQKGGNKIRNSSIKGGNVYQRKTWDEIRSEKNREVSIKIEEEIKAGLL